LATKQKMKELKVWPIKAIDDNADDEETKSVANEE
jgi:hypothetical protein